VGEKNKQSLFIIATRLLGLPYSGIKVRQVTIISYLHVARDGGLLVSVIGRHEITLYHCLYGPQPQRILHDKRSNWQNVLWAWLQFLLSFLCHI